MRILFLDPFHGGSHAAVSEGYALHSRHDVTIWSLSIAGGWRWRMRGAAVTFARRLREYSGAGFDLIVTTDMLDLATFLGLARKQVGGAAVALYMHENQCTYPLPAGRERDLAFPWMNYTSALSADRLFFNSAFHRRAFLEAIPGLTGRFYDHQELDLIDSIAAKSHVLPPGIDLARLDLPAQQIIDSPPENTAPIILWNSRWEYDKAPHVFFEALDELERRDVDFRVIVAGEHIDPREPSFLAARERLSPRTVAWGYAPDISAYRSLLHQADIVVSTAIQEFFGIAVIEAMYCGCVPVLPRRLSYPELLPPEYHSACLYDKPAGLAQKLETTIHNLPALKQLDFRSVAAPYDWSLMAPRYDAAFEQCAGSNLQSNA